MRLEFDKEKRYQLLTESGENLLDKLAQYDIYIEMMSVVMDHEGPSILIRIMGHGLSLTISDEEMKEALVGIIHNPEPSCHDIKHDKEERGSGVTREHTGF